MAALIATGMFTLVGCTSATGAPAQQTPAQAEVPAITALSPVSSKIGSPAFTLSVVGSHFHPDAIVQWDQVDIAPTSVSNILITAEIPADLLLQPGSHSVSVVNPGDSGGLSNSLVFSIPCEISGPTPASNQTRARLGAYYFDGWSGSLDSQPFTGMPLGSYQGRQPESGWQDLMVCSVEQQLASAHNFGVDFFVFDWYFNPGVNDPGQNLNSAFEITRALPDRHGMQYSILYIDAPPFIASPQDWPIVVNEWVGYMTDPDYVRVNGKPLLVIYDMSAMRRTFGCASAVASALNQLRATAIAQGLPGVYIAGGFYAGYDIVKKTGSLPDLSAAVPDGYDAITMYNYSVGGVKGKQPFSVLSQAAQWMWAQGAQHSPLPFIPVAMNGWDARPWGNYDLWYQRNPEDVASLVDSAITWTNAHPQLRPEPASVPPLVFVEAWNELGEGSYFIPTTDDGTTYGDALAKILQKQ